MTPMEFPKTVKLSSGKEIILRPMESGDEVPLLHFFQSVPAEDRMFFRDDVTNPAVIRRWARTIDYERMIPLLAFDGDRVVADASLHRQASGWSPHVGEIRVSVATDCRGQGLGTALAREIFHLALSLKLEKVMAQMMSCQNAAMAVFESLGFTQEAVLKNYVRDQRGAKHDLIIMMQDVEDFWKHMEDAIAESHRDFSGDYRVS